MGGGKRGRSKGGEVGAFFPSELHPIPGSAQACVPAAPYLLLPPFLVLFQAPDLLKQAALLLTQPHNLLIGISIILFPRPQDPSLLHEAQGLFHPILEQELPPPIPTPEGPHSSPRPGHLSPAQGCWWEAEAPSASWEPLASHGWTQSSGGREERDTWETC